jgi:hypothetical protein
MKINSILVLFMIGCFLSYSYSIDGQNQTLQTKQIKESTDIPEQFLALYQELEESLHQAIQLFPYKKGKYCSLAAPELYFAGSGFGSSATDSQRWKDLLSTLDEFKSMKIEAVSIMIAAPDLTIGDSTSLVIFYQRLANEIHLRKMKLYIEYFDNPPFSPHALKGWQDNLQGRKDFLAMKEKELFLIYREIKPDYLSLVTEPGTMMRWSHLNFSSDELAEWIGEVSTSLKNLGSSPNTLIGAGAGSWESADFILKFAQQSNLDYIDIHLYAMNSSIKDNAIRVDSLVHQVRKVRPGMEITIGETWLYKHSTKEPATVAMYKETFFRDNFSFWSPLDQQFMELLMGIAQKENVSVVAPYFSQYFFSYYKFGDTESSNLPPWPGSVIFSWNKAIESIHHHQLSATGKVMSSMLDYSCK